MLPQQTLSLGSMTKDMLKKCYEQMVLIRRFEERTGQLYGQGLIGGFCIKSSGGDGQLRFECLEMNPIRQQAYLKSDNLRLLSTFLLIALSPMFYFTTFK